MDGIVSIKFELFLLISTKNDSEPGVYLYSIKNVLIFILKIWATSNNYKEDDTFLYF